MAKGWANPDVRTWIDAAIGLHVRDGVPVEDTRATLVSQLLAEILWYCGFEPPGKWKDVGEGSLIEAARAQGTLAELNPVGAGAWADAAKQAMESGDWASIQGLPADVWRWIKTLTGVDRAEWEALPSYVDTLLDLNGRCPVCGRSGPVREIGRMNGFWEPLEYGAGGSLSVCCSRCGDRLVLAEDSPLQEEPRKWGQALVWSAIGIIILLILGFGIALRYVLSGSR